jgi:hypothetical protein
MAADKMVWFKRVLFSSVTVLFVTAVIMYRDVGRNHIQRNTNHGKSVQDNT